MLFKLDFLLSIQINSNFLQFSKYPQRSLSIVQKTSLQKFWVGYITILKLK